MIRKRHEIAMRIPQETLDRVRKQMSCKWYCNGGDCGKGLPGTPCDLVGCVAWEEKKRIDMGSKICKPKMMDCLTCPKNNPKESFCFDKEDCSVPFAMVRDGKIIAWEENKEDKKMNGWKLTKVWQVDHKLVVADTVEEAVALFKAFMGNDYRDEPKEIHAISTNFSAFREYNALIKEEQK